MKVSGPREHRDPDESVRLGGKQLSPAALKAIAAFEREMDEKVIPEIIAVMRQRALDAARTRFLPLFR